MKISRKCDVCLVDYEYESGQKSKYCSPSCRTSSYNQRKISGIEGIDYVVCEICNLKFREINNDHLRDKHNISCDEYDNLYGTGKRTSEKTKSNKNTLSSIMSPEMSQKLSNSHKIQNYILKYGEIDGHDKYNKMINNKKYKNGHQSYIDKYGVDGLSKFREVQLKKGVTLNNQIKLYGIDSGTKKYIEWKEKQKIKNTLSYYIKTFGQESGLLKWMQKNDNISIANSKIDKSKRGDFIRYVIDVNKFTRISLNIHDILLKELRGKKEGYDLDHLVSKIDGFKNNIPPYIIGHISNLKIVKDSYNRKKQHKSDIDIQEILDKYELDTVYKSIVGNIIEIRSNFP